jgi:predicted dithiol-disulfide oxidoreductase (DUF899 family)
MSAQLDQKIAKNYQEWREARLSLLDAEKELTRLSDKVAAQRRALPWLAVSASYTFVSTSGAAVSLVELFGDKSDLVVAHMMFDNTYSGERPCKNCSFWADSYDALNVHFARKAAFAVVAKAGHEKLAAVAKAKGWHFALVSSAESTFNRDLAVEFTQQEVDAKAPLYNFGTAPPFTRQCPGFSVFHRDADTGQVFRTYSTYARGLDALNLCYRFLDLLPNGRDTNGPDNRMQWVHHKEDY